MKKIIYILTAAALMLTACAKEVIVHPNEKDAPQTASAYNPVVTVDQELNQVTFSLGEKGVVPVWVLQNGVGEWAEYHARDDFKKIFVTAGDYSVRMYVMNAAGTSPDYVEKTFHIENTIVDFSRYIRYISGGESRVWRINNAVKGHLACGEAVADPTGWWSAEPNEKDGTGLYDNRLTFTSDGSYTFDPGAAGTVYVNVGVTKAPYAQSGNDADYALPQAQVSTTYDFTVDGNDIKLVLPAGTPFPYIPNNDYISDSRFFLQSITNDEMVLVWYTPTGNNDGPIAWQLIFTSKEGDAPAVSPLVGSWVMDSSVPEHFACGESIANPASYWSAKPNEKSNTGLYDNVLTFTADGKYIFDPGPDGNIYVNTAVTKLDKSDTIDFDYPWEKQETTYEFDGETLTLPAGTMIGYIPNDNYFDNASFTVTALTDNAMTLVWFDGGIAWKFMFKKEGSDEGDLIEGENLWADAECEMLYWYSGTDWAGGLSPAEAEILPGNGLRVVMPEGIGGSEWMGQNAFHMRSLPAYKDEVYDFWCTLEADEDMIVTVKLAWDENDRTNAFFYDNSVELKANEPLKYVRASIRTDDGSEIRNDYDGIVLFVDTGRSPVGSEVKISDIHFQKHIGGGGGGGDVTPDDKDYTTNDPSIPNDIYDIEGAGNLWRKAAITTDWWFSGSDWVGGLDPIVFKADDWGGIKVIVPEGIGGNEWMGQVKFHTDIPAKADNTYDFCVTVKSDEDINDLTFKLAWEENDNDHAMFYVNDAKIKAGVTYTFKMTEISPDVDYDKIVLFIDCGRCKVGTAVSFTNFCFQETSGAASYGKNLFNGQGTLKTWFSGSDWTGGLEPDATYTDGKVNLTIPDGIGGSEWMGQVKIFTDIPIDKTKLYDYKATVKATDDGSFTAKLTSDDDPPGNEFFYDGGLSLVADTPCVVSRTGIGMNIDNQTFLIIFDFGRLPVGTKVEISDIVIREIL